MVSIEYCGFLCHVGKFTQPPARYTEGSLVRELEERGIGGLGIHLTRKLFDEFAYERRDDKNVVRLRKKSV